jgi:hypothetical protein
MTNDLLLAIAATITAFGVVIGAFVAIYRVAKRIGDAMGVDSKGRTISDRLDRVEHQLWENGGSSLADRVNNIEKHVVKVSTEIEFIKDLTMGLHNASTSSTQVFFPAIHDEVVEPIKKPIRRRKAS